MDRSVLVLDNYDSFTYNLVHLFRELDCNNLTVVRNDKIEVAAAGSFDLIVLSPGPGIPLEAGNMTAIVEAYAVSHRILGVCLGHQCIAEIFGAKLLNLSKVMHGKGSELEVVDGTEEIFSGLPARFTVGRYHSWEVARTDWPSCLRITAQTDDGCIMALRHQEYDVRGVQFHPESVLTQHGAQMIRNWLVCGDNRQQ